MKNRTTETKNNSLLQKLKIVKQLLQKINNKMLHIKQNPMHSLGVDLYND